MQTTAIGTVAKSLPQNVVILLTLLIPKRYIPYTDLLKKFALVKEYLSTKWSIDIDELEKIVQRRMGDISELDLESLD